jgi:hypothetical protein
MPFIFLVLHWDVAKRPFLIQLAGAILMGIGAVAAGGFQSTP